MRFKKIAKQIVYVKRGKRKTIYLIKVRLIHSFNFFFQLQSTKRKVVYNGDNGFSFNNLKQCNVII